MAQKERLDKALPCHCFAISYLYVRAPLPIGIPSHMYERVRVSQYKKIISHTKRCMRLFGAEGETRTLAPVSRPTPLAGAPRHQLEYFCKCNGFNHYLIKKRAVNTYNPHLAERVGFEPTVRCRTTVFKTVPL